MRRRIGGFVQIDDTVLQVCFQIASQGTAATGKWSVVCRTNVQFVVVFEQERPLTRIEGRGVLGRGNQLGGLRGGSRRSIAGFAFLGCVIIISRKTV